jgi:hypothetical protein
MFVFKILNEIFGIIEPDVIRTSRRVKSTPNSDPVCIFLHNLVKVVDTLQIFIAVNTPKSFHPCNIYI